MSPRPSFQFYPADHLANANLKRCTHELRGAWVDVMCLMHGSSEYGILRWPLGEIAQAVGCPTKVLEGLVAKDVMKGAHEGEHFEGYVFTPRSGRREGPPVVLIDPCPGPLWFSSRMVRDEYIRGVRGEGSRFTEGSPDPSPMPPKRQGQGRTKASPDPSPMPPFGEGSDEEGKRTEASPKPSPKPSPNPAPKPGISDGPSSSSSSSCTEVPPVAPLAGGDTHRRTRGGESLESLLGKGTPMWEAYWALHGLFGESKNPSPASTAAIYARIIAAGTSPETIHRAAQAQRESCGDARYMPKLKTWLEGEAYLRPASPGKAKAAKVVPLPDPIGPMSEAERREYAEMMASRGRAM